MIYWMAAIFSLYLSFTLTFTECGECGEPANPKVPLAALPGAKTYVYKTVDGMPLQLHVFFPEPNDLTQKRATIVFFFGGGWTGGSPRQFLSHAKLLAERGMVAICAEYRIKTRHGTDPFVCPEDGKSAVRWIRTHAQELGIDPQRLAAGGGSAGGHVAASTALLPDFESAGEDLTISSKPNSLVLFNPVIDTTSQGYGANRLGERAEAMSPVHHVAAGAPPTIIFHGTGDKTVPFENVQRFQKLMQECGNSCELVPFDDRGHGFFNQGKPDYEATVKGMLEFLTKQGYLKNP